MLEEVLRAHWESGRECTGLALEERKIFVVLVLNSTVE
jgi:hypothetical protein